MVRPALCNNIWISTSQITYRRGLMLKTNIDNVKTQVPPSAPPSPPPGHQKGITKWSATS